MPTMVIDGREVTAPPGANLIEAAKLAGIEIPHFCYHPALKVVASCRMCFVEVTQEVRGKATTRLTTACNTPAADGMVVRTDTQPVEKAQNDILEFLLINHPVDCPVCDEAGECKLQDYAFAYGTASSRFAEHKRFRHAKKLGSGIRLYTNRCILCDRCVRFLRDFVGTGELSVTDMGNGNEISVFPGKPIDNVLAGNLPEICPVGALISEDFLFKARVWNLSAVDSVCPGCSRGCATFLDVKDNEVQRTRARENHAANGYFICDDGRYLYHVIRHETRLEHPAVRDGDQLRESNWDHALDVVFSRLAEFPERVVILLSPFLTQEEARAGADLSEVLRGSVLGHVPNAVQEAPVLFPGGFAIDGDKAPNSTLVKNIAPVPLQELAITKDTVALFFNSSLRTGSVSPLDAEKLRRAGFVAVIAVLRNDITAVADVVLPGRMWAEKSGTFFNSAGMTQSFGAAVLPPPFTRDESDVIRDLTRRITTRISTGCGAKS